MRGYWTATALPLLLVSCGPTNGVNLENQRPEAAVEQVSVSRTALVLRDVSTDPDGDLLTRHWRLRSRSGQARLVTEGDTATIEPLSEGVWTIVLEVSDGLLTDTYPGTFASGSAYKPLDRDTDPEETLPTGIAPEEVTP